MSIKEKDSAAEQPSVLTDEQLRDTDGYKLGWMEGMQEGADLATDGIADLLPGSCYMDPPDGGSPTVLEQISRMAEDAAQWRAHLARQSPAPEKDEPVTPEEVVAFIGSHYDYMHDADDIENIKYQLSVHDLLSAFRWWFEDFRAPVAQEVEPGSAPAAADEVRDAVWRPISTVPMDGSEVLLYLGQPFSRVAKARWFDVWENWIEGEFPDVQDEYGGIGSRVPSHWMPLPAAPEVKTTASAATSADGGAA